MARAARNMKRKAVRPTFTIEARVKRGHAELVKVPLVAGEKEEVIQVLRGPVSRKRALRGRGLLSDSTGQVALEAFRLAVREAKKQ